MSVASGVETILPEDVSTGFPTREIMFPVSQSVYCIIWPRGDFSSPLTSTTKFELPLNLKVRPKPIENNLLN